MMSSIRCKDTKPEFRVRRRLHGAGLRYRLHVKDLPGKPDLVFTRALTVVFVHGCFWHQHLGCGLAYRPSSNVEFWSKKLQANVERDARVADQLSNAGWLVETVWECEPIQCVDDLAGRIKVRSEGSRHPIRPTELES
jgi:DNA mismatch endonuclease (patch repair protein)